MKVLIINSLYYPNIMGGAERSVQFIAESLVTAGHTPIIISSVPEAGVQVQMVNGVKVYYVGLKNIYWTFKKQKPKQLKPLWQMLDAYNPFMAKLVEKIIQQEQPDVVHTNTLSGFSVAVWPKIKQMGIPLIHTLRDYYLLCPECSMYRKGKNCEKPCWSCNLFSLPKHRLSACVDYVIGISQFILDKHCQFSLFPNARKSIIFNSYAAPDIPARVASEKLRIGFIGRLRGLKGIERILEAMTCFDKENVSLVIAGSGEARYEQKLRAMSTGNVEFLGFVKPAEFFRQVDLLVAPSLWHEPLGRIVFEAYAHGIPVIGAKRGGIPELIDIGKTGYLFDPDDRKSLVKEIKRFIADPGLSLAMQANCLIKAKEYLPQKIVEQYLTVYNEVCKK